MSADGRTKAPGVADAVTVTPRRRHARCQSGRQTDGRDRVTPTCAPGNESGSTGVTSASSMGIYGPFSSLERSPKSSRLPSTSCRPPPSPVRARAFTVTHRHARIGQGSANVLSRGPKNEMVSLGGP